MISKCINSRKTIKLKVLFSQYLSDRMVSGNIEERIKKMKEAILIEAKQRAHTLVQNASEEADQERAKIYNLQKEKIQHEFTAMSKAERVKEKIQKSALNNRHRIRRMQARYEFVEKLKEEVKAKLKTVVQDQGRYTELTKKLIVQAMLRMMERNVTVELRSEHAGMAERLFPECQKMFSSVMLSETAKEMESKLSLSEYYLEEKNQNIVGGVFLRSSDGVIVCDNSLDSRVRLIFEQLLPSIRACLFPNKAPLQLI